mmetsp:Transcript_48468/g.125744  ORF Transcript_48468/g.125744 Transcript_48468/m.125744 type:complete len:373 (-) Transcript_48468:543-1661(-)
MPRPLKLAISCPATNKNVDMSSEKSQRSGAKKMCATLLPGWNEVPEHTIEVTKITGGITNILYKVERSDTKENALVRLYGLNTEKLIDREKEIVLFGSLGNVGFGPQLLGTFGNGRIEQFFKARPLEPSEMTEESRQEAIAQKLAELHDFQPESDNGDESASEKRRPVVFRTIEKWFQEVDQMRFSGDGAFEKNELLKKLNIKSIKSTYARVKEACDRLPSTLVFAHNDLLCGNVLLVFDEDDSPSDVRIIDYEYAGFNPRAYDIANHFCEYAGFDADFAKGYPDRDVQGNFLKAYLGAERGEEGVESAEIRDFEVDKMFTEVNVYAPLAHIYWGLWSCMQALYSSIDFNFLDYARLRFEGLKWHLQQYPTL